MRRLAIIGIFCISLPLWSQPAAEPWQIEKIAGGFVFTEGPVWHIDQLLFSDLSGNKIYSWTGEGGIKIFLDPSGKTNGLAIDTEGRLVMAQQEYRRMSRMETDGSVTPLATHFEGKRLNIPNDVAAKSDGSVFFTDPPIGISAAQQELDFSGIFRISKNGMLYLLDKTVFHPNGIAFSRDESTLYVSDSEDKKVYAWDVEDTVITGKRLFTTIGGNGYIDGMTTDNQGRLYVASPLGIQVFEENGTRADTIRIGKQCSNCSWGEEVGQDLFVTCGTELYRVNKQGPGVGFVEVESGTTPKTALFAPIPNPVQGDARISFYIPKTTQVRLTVYNIAGRFICTLFDQEVNPGKIHVNWHTENLEPGLYHLQLETKSGRQAVSCVLL